MTVSNSPYYYGYYAVDSAAGVATASGSASSSSGSGVGGASGAGADAGTTASVDTSDHLAIIDMSQGKLALTYDQPTELDNLDLMGVQQNKLFVNLQGDGILVVDVTNSSAPKWLSFHRSDIGPAWWNPRSRAAAAVCYYYGTYYIDTTAPGNL